MGTLQFIAASNETTIHGGRQTVEFNPDRAAAGQKRTYDAPENSELKVRFAARNIDNIVTSRCREVSTLILNRRFRSKIFEWKFECRVLLGRERGLFGLQHAIEGAACLDTRLVGLHVE